MSSKSLKEVFVLIVTSLIMISCVANQSRQGQPHSTETRTQFLSTTLTTDIAESSNPTREIRTVSSDNICRFKNVLFIGGSITAGAGASEKTKSYASKVGQWFIESCPYDDIRIKNISVGGTGSDFAVFRLEHDLQGFIPDISFYEFAVNDSKRPSQEEIIKYTSALIHKLRRMNPEMLIFSVITTRADYQQFYEKGILPPAVSAHIRAANVMNVPVINIGHLFWISIFENDLQVQEYLPDGVHPSDLGHQFYYESVVQFLKSFFNIPADTKVGIELSNATLVDMSNVTTTCEKVKKKSGEYYLVCDKGDMFSTSFEGNVFGVVGIIRPNGGRLSCILDSTLSGTMEFWDEYSIRFNLGHIGYQFLFTNIERKKHTVTCTVSSQDNSSGIEQSSGEIVEVRYFMINP